MGRAWDVEITTQIVVSAGDQTESLIKNLLLVMWLDYDDVEVSENCREWGHGGKNGLVALHNGSALTIDAWYCKDGSAVPIIKALRAFNSVTLEAASVFENENESFAWYIGSEDQIAILQSRDALDCIIDRLTLLVDSDKERLLKILSF
jgi:hypothetical protein